MFPIAGRVWGSTYRTQLGSLLGTPYTRQVLPSARLDRGSWWLGEELSCWDSLGGGESSDLARSSDHCRLEQTSLFPGPQLHENSPRKERCLPVPECISVDSASWPLPEMRP